MLQLFRRRGRDEARGDVAADLKARLRAHLALGDDDVLTVSEIVCPDPSCPGTETIVLVLRRGRATVALKMSKPIDEVGAEDIGALSLPDGP